MTAFAGVLRDAAGLATATAELGRIGVEADALPGGIPAVHELRSLVAVGSALTAAASDRHESRGCHHRLDFPEHGQTVERIVHGGSGGRARVAAWPGDSAVLARDR